ncbi:MAG: hypothetical protein MUF43_05125 [Flavobacterium sp.]|jgi:hypothetical protein|nr:hypothetical protein [Flavobacterium sp.]
MTKTTIAKVLIITLMIFAKENLTAQWNGFNPIWTNSDVGIGLNVPDRQLHLKMNACDTSSENAFLEKVNNPIRITREAGETSFTIDSRGFPRIRVSNCKTINWDYKVNTKNFSQIFNVNANDATGQLFSVDMIEFGKDGNTSMLPFTFQEDALFKKNVNVSGVLNLSTIKSSANTLLINSNSVQIGNQKATFHPDAKLHVAGKVAAQHFVVTKPTNWSDKVFDKNYKLLPLAEVEAFIAKNKHLPAIPCEAEIMEKGYDTNEMDALLLQKIEELTLHMIELKKENEALKKDLSNLKNK